jgi:hypothetical protein
MVRYWRVSRIRSFIMGQALQGLVPRQECHPIHESRVSAVWS